MSSSSSASSELPSPVVVEEYKLTKQNHLNVSGEGSPTLSVKMMTKGIVNNNPQTNDIKNTDIRSKSPTNMQALNKLLNLSTPKREHLKSNHHQNQQTLEIDTNKKEVNKNENDSGEDKEESIVKLEDIFTISPTESAEFSGESEKRIHRIVLTGGPCAGKTTSIQRIRSFFENIGWKAFCVPETATLLLGSGIQFYELGNYTIDFQENLLKTLLQIEDTINDAARFYHREKKQNCIIIYDRGAMDPVAYLNEDDWLKLKQRNSTWNEVDLRDNRYDQIIHMVTAAQGAEQYYLLENNQTRTEGIQLARDCDEKCARSWTGHPYFDVIENHTDFEVKLALVLQAVCDRVGLQLKGFDVGNRKRKFLVNIGPEILLDGDGLKNNTGPFPTNSQDFNVIHNYLASNTPKIQARLRKRGQSNVWSYTYTVRKRDNNQTVETRRQIDKKEYAILYKTIDTNHFTVYKVRRCFEWCHRYYQLDIYEEPCNPRCRGLAILTTHSLDEDLLLPDFLDIDREITDDPDYSMFNLSLKKSKKIDT